MSIEKFLQRQWSGYSAAHRNRTNTRPDPFVSAAVTWIEEAQAMVRVERFCRSGENCGYPSRSSLRRQRRSPLVGPPAGAAAGFKALDAYLASVNFSIDINRTQHVLKHPLIIPILILRRDVDAIKQ